MSVRPGIEHQPSQGMADVEQVAQHQEAEQGSVSGQELFLCRVGGDEVERCQGDGKRCRHHRGGSHIGLKEFGKGGEPHRLVGYSFVPLGSQAYGTGISHLTFASWNADTEIGCVFSKVAPTCLVAYTEYTPGGNAFEVGVLTCGKDSSDELSPLTDTHLYITVHPGSGWPFLTVFAMTVIRRPAPHLRQSLTLMLRSLAMLSKTCFAASCSSGRVLRMFATSRHHLASCARSSTYSFGGAATDQSLLRL